MTRVSDGEALGALWSVHRRHGTGRWHYAPRGPMHRALARAEALGWVWSPAPGIGAVTRAGLAALEFYRGAPARDPREEVRQ